MKDSIEEKKRQCSKIFISWSLSHVDWANNPHDEDIANIFTSRMILKKFEVFGIDIIIPDPLLLMLAICTDGNPGQYQIILKDLLLNIKKVKGPIPKGYCIEPQDIVEMWPINFPIVDIPEVYDKYMKLWDEQKKEHHEEFESDNKCDTPEWWLEVME